ncbi:hypothetical protein BGX27_008852 [Mortierella sp. AM989]|nr:hypothetical protein BGX27_008852 [Mortierella sp. AM989]
MNDITTTQTGIMKLPPEILLRVAAFIERASIFNACLVCKDWLVCMRSELWSQVCPYEFTGQQFFEQFPHYYEHIRSLTISIPCDTKNLTELLGVPSDEFEDDFDDYTNDDEEKSDSLDEQTDNDDDDVPSLIPALPEKSLQDCRRLEYFEITYEAGIRDMHMFPSDVWTPFSPQTESLISAVDTIMRNNQSTLRELVVSRLSIEIEERILKSIKEMPVLRSLTLRGWESLTDGGLKDVLQHCSQNLRYLSLDMNDLSGNLWKLRRWRLRWDSIQKAKASGKVTTEYTRLKDVGLTRVQTLILDRSTLGMQTLLDLAAVMPDLRVLSIEDTFGIAQEHGDFDSDGGFFDEDEGDEDSESESDEGSEADGEDGDDDMEEPDATMPPSIHELYLTQLVVAQMAVQAAAQAAAQAAIPGPHSAAAPTHNPFTNNGNSTYEPQDGSPHAPVGSFPTAPSGSEDEWEDFGSDMYTSDNEETLGISCPFSAEISGHPPAQRQKESSLFRKIRQLHAYCPLIQSFNFSECRPDQLDDKFLEFICELWGPSSTDDHDGSYSTSTSSPPQKSLGLKDLLAENLCGVRPGFFETIMTHCGSTLTRLNLSLNADIRWEVRQRDYENEMDIRMYYGGVHLILNNCPTLELLHVEAYPINARLVASEDKWVCTRMKSLRICIEFDATTYHPGGEAAAKEDDRMIQLGACRQLGQLTRLEDLRLEGGRILTPKSLDPMKYSSKARRTSGKDCPFKRSHLNLSLSTGLEELAGLKHLESLDITHLGPHSLREPAEAEWLRSHWPALRKLDGFYDRDILRANVEKLRDQLGPLACTMPSKTVEQRKRQAAYERIQRRGILFTPEMDLNYDPVLRRICEGRDISIDFNLMEQLLTKEGLKKVAIFEKDGIHICGKPGGKEMTEEEKAVRRYNDYIVHTDYGLNRLRGPAAGGRDNSELMSDVMRPRGGRSPSPLGTWY